MKIVGILSKPDLSEYRDLIKNLLDFLTSRGLKILIDEQTGKSIGLKKVLSKEQIMEESDFLIVLGGDGTILKCARYAGLTKKPLLFTVNLGRLGFLTEVTPEKMIADLEKFLSGKYFVDSRFLLRVNVYRDSKKVFSSLALNEAVINQGSFARLIRLSVKINKHNLNDFNADGLIVATPTGSTGHALSAGGPIMFPSIPAFLITPICPASLSNRPILVPNSKQISITLQGRRKFEEDPSVTGLTVDGQLVFPLEHGDEIRIRKSKRELQLIRMKKGGYYKMLRTKLGWRGEIG